MEKTGVLFKGIGIDTQCFGIALAANQLRFLQGFGFEARDFEIGFRANFQSLFFTFGAVFFGLPFAFGAHAFKHVVFVFARQVCAFNPHIEDINAQSECCLVGALCHCFHDILAVRNYDLDQRALPEFFSNSRKNDVVQARLCIGDILHRYQKFEWICDAPAGEIIHDEVFLVLCVNLSGIGIAVQQAIFEGVQLLDKRNFKMQAGGLHGAYGLPKFCDDDLFAFIHDITRRIQ